MNSTTLSSLVNEKSFAGRHTCRGAPSSLVIRNAASKQTTLSLLGTSETGYQGVLWTTTALRLQWLVPLMHEDVCRSPVHGGTELSLQALYDCWQTLCPWQWKCCCLLPLNDGPGTLSLPANVWLVVWTILLSHLGEKLLMPLVNFLGFVAYNIWTVSFFFRPCCPNSNPGLSAFLCVRIFCIFSCSSFVSQLGTLSAIVLKFFSYHGNWL